jgi:hypothetical protein
LEPRVGRERSYNLDTLFEALKIAPDDDSARAIEQRIWALWMPSGSDTCDVLMGRVKAATQQKDFELAIKLLSAVIELKPNYTEAWNRRASMYFFAEGLRPRARRHSRRGALWSSPRVSSISAKNATVKDTAGKVRQCRRRSPPT